MFSLTLVVNRGVLSVMSLECHCCALKPNWVLLEYWKRVFLLVIIEGKWKSDFYYINDKPTTVLYNLEIATYIVVLIFQHSLTFFTNTTSSIQVKHWIFVTTEWIKGEINENILISSPQNLIFNIQRVGRFTF